MSMRIALREAENKKNESKGKFVSYTVSSHAESRAVSRLGLTKQNAKGHLLMLMQTAYYQGQTSTPNGPSLVYDHHNSRTRLIVNEERDTIITVYKMLDSEDVPKYEMSFLRPVLEREIRKMERHHTKLIRQIELDLALTYKKFGEMSVNHAKARNPNTRSLIEGRISEVQAIIDGYTARIERVKDEHSGKIKAIEEMME